MVVLVLMVLVLTVLALMTFFLVVLVLIILVIMVFVLMGCFRLRYQGFQLLYAFYLKRNCKHNISGGAKLLTFLHQVHLSFSHQF